MSFQELVDRVRAGFAAADKSKVPFKDITQYNITKDGAVVKTLVFNFKDFVFSEVAVSDYDVDITISSEDVIETFKGTAKLADLHSAVSYKNCALLYFIY